jgi:hypothetical protein
MASRIQKVKKEIVICAYCEVNPSNDTEHVFPKSLGGESLYIDCVCDVCNNIFSALERELVQKSPIALWRNLEGIDGHSKNKIRPAALKSSDIFLFDSDTKVVYDVGIYDGFRSYIRPQIIQIKGKLYYESASLEEGSSFNNAFIKWRKSSSIFITSLPEKKGSPYKGVKLSLINGKVECETLELTNVKNAIVFHPLTQGDYEHIQYFDPRLLFDDSRNLIVRSRSVNEGISFLKKLLNYCERKPPPKFRSYSLEIKHNTIGVSMNFNGVKLEQALVKIGLNCLMHYHPNTKYDPLLKAAKSYVFSGNGIRASFDKKNDILESNPEIHRILFFQHKESLQVRISLFGGSFIYSFLVDHLILSSTSGIVSAVEIYYKDYKQKHYSINDFILNMIKDNKWNTT